jgi:hypothetical protein
LKIADTARLEGSLSNHRDSPYQGSKFFRIRQTIIHITACNE